MNSYAFEDCRNLETISFPEAITIGSNAFKGCNALASAAFPKANFIGDGAFESCAALKTLTLGAARPTSVSATAFTGCPDDRKLALVGVDGAVLADDDAAWASYKAAGDGDTTDSYWVRLEAARKGPARRQDRHHAGRAVPPAGPAWRMP